MENIEAERVKIREELSKMNFEELENLKRKIGTKVFKKISTDESDESSVKRDFKRPTKNHPREMSSKIRPPRINNKKNKNVTTFRDPRFDPLCGSYEEKSFKENYKFVHELRKKELQELKKEYENAEDEKTKKRIKLVIQRLDNKVKAEETRDQEMLKKQVEINEIKTKLKHGEKPIFKKKGERKAEELLQKYEDLKKQNKVQKYIEKRAKKMKHSYPNISDT